MVYEKKIYVNGKEVKEIEGKPVKYDKFGKPYIVDGQMEYVDLSGNLAYIPHVNYGVPERLRISQLKLEDVMPAEAAALFPEGSKVMAFDPKLDGDKPFVIVGGYAVLLPSASYVSRVTELIMSGKLRTGAYEGYK